MMAAETFTAIQRELEDLRQYVEEVESKAAAEVAAEREARITADRQRERFRYALWVYLQERDRNGGEYAGIHAPTPETLKLIRELCNELDSDKEQ